MTFDDIFSIFSTFFSLHTLNRISPEGVDIILDCLCGDDCNRGYGLLKPMGKYILFGSSNVVTGETKSFFSVARSVRGNWRNFCFVFVVFNPNFTFIIHSGGKSTKSRQLNSLTRTKLSLVSTYVTCSINKMDLNMFVALSMKFSHSSRMEKLSQSSIPHGHLKM